jgi:CRP/FNR family transcriptional regulator, cyclic AMP receptor protein
MRDTGPDILRGFAVFAGLDEAVVQSLSRRCRWKAYGPRELVIGHEDRSLDVLFLVDGRAVVSLYSPDGQRVSYGEISKGGIVGEISAIDGDQRSATIECQESCSVAIMPRSVFLEALADHPPFALAIMRHLTEMVRRLTARAFEFSTLRVRERVAAELLRIARLEPLISPAPTHEEIASRIGTHREAVTRELAWLEDQNLIAREGRTLHINDAEGLRKLAEY